MINGLSVVIPVGPRDCAWVLLVEKLKSFATNIQIVLVFYLEEVEEQSVAVNNFLNNGGRLVVTAQGRAAQMNSGVRFIDGESVLFLHADSMVEEKSLTALLDLLAKPSNSMYYFDLAFTDGGPRLMLLNQWGCWLRSRVLGLPFGDQGFCLSKSIFWAVGGFSENLTYGEDHVLVWRLRSFGIKMAPVKMPIFTSARKYTKNGWVQVTFLHLFLTYWQAAEYFYKFLKHKASGFRT
tara:strand:- start:47 stop:757 length:711 start_codon:yes stop_codon:yes gene_type:complete